MANPYIDFYTSQTGKGMQVFAGSRTQRGHGLGAILGGLARMVIPVAKKSLTNHKKSSC